MRSLPLFGLVLLMLLMAGGVFAADDYTAFPFLSASTDQANMLANAFAFQMQLFLGVSDAGSGLSALRILAMLGVLIGATLIIFFPKYQKMPVVATWLLLVIIVMFVPLGSKLLFHPITIVKARMLPYNDRPEPVQNGSDCVENPGGCGFTPQLVSAHLGTVIQVIASDIFRSTGWAGLLERQTAATELYTKNDFNLGQGWVEAIRDYGQCDVDLKDLVKGVDKDKDKPITPYRMIDAWKNLGKDFVDPKGNFAKPPPVIVFPTSAAKIEEFKWDPKTISDYENGLTSFCNEYCSSGNKQKVVKVTPESGSDEQISAEDMFKDIKVTYPLFFSALAQSGFTGGFTNFYNSIVGAETILNGPGIFFATSDDLTDEYMQSRVCYVQELSETWMGGYFKDADASRSISDCVMTKATGTNGEYLYRPRMHATTYNYATDNFIKAPNRTEGVGELWAPLIQLLQGSHDNTFQKMPVALGDVSTPVSSGESAEKYPNKKIDIRSGLSCFDKGRRVIDIMVNSLKEKQPSKAQYFGELYEMLKVGGKDVPIHAEDKDKPGYRPYTLAFEDISDLPFQTANETDTDKTKMVQMMQTRMNEAIRMVNLEGQTDVQTALKAAMVNSLMELMRRVTMQSADMMESELTQNAVTDATHLNKDITGVDVLTNAGGSIAFILGKFIAKIGAMITGPLAYAFVQFLTVLVDFTLMVIITVTPLLFLFGLVVPTAAAGVLTIAVLSVFILKFVPVTLIILNGIGGMVYDLLPASVGLNSDFTRDLLVLAMGGLYLNIVGLTFFLIFKIGDPAAFLGRLTALDGAAKQLADRGMAATKTLAAAAGALAIGAGAGAIGGLLGNQRLKNVSNTAMDNLKNNLAGTAEQLGMPKGGMAMLKGMTEETGEPTAPGPKKGDGTDGDDAGDETAANAAGTLGQSSPTGTQADPLKGLSKEERDALTPEQRAMFGSSEAGSFRDEAGLKGLNGEETNRLIAGFGVEKDGTVYSRQTAADGSWELVSEPAVGQSPVGEARSVGIPSSVGPAGTGPIGELGAPGTPGGGGGAAPSGSGAPAVMIAGGQLGSVGEVGRMGEGAVQNKIAELETQRVAQSADAMKQQLAAAAQQNPAVRAEMQALSTQLNSATSQGDIDAIKNDADSLLKRSGSSLMDVSAKQSASMNMNQQLAGAMTTFRMKNGEALDKIESKVKHLGNDDDKIRAVLSDDEYAIKKSYDSLRTDTAGLTQGEMSARLGTVDSLNQAMSARAMADTNPTNWQAAKSGLFGSLKGSGAGLARIPLLGPAIVESMNEYYEAPERARVQNMVGGKRRYDELRDASQRMGFFNKEMAPMVSGQQYESMVARGGFQAQYEIAAQSARESVERNRNQYEAMNAGRKAQLAPALEMTVRKDLESNPTIKASFDKLTPDQQRVEVDMEVGRRFNNIVADPKQYDKLVANFKAGLKDQVISEGVEPAQVDVEVNRRLGATGMPATFQTSLSSGDLIGLGRQDAANRVTSVRQEALIMQGAPLKVLRAKGGLDGDMNVRMGVDAKGNPIVETEEVNVVLTADMLNKFSGDLSTKRFAKGMDDMMIAHYGLAEKQFLRGDVEWNQSRNMNMNASAAAAFVRKDVSTDYLVGGHLNMVSGKERFLEGKGQYDSLLKMRNETNRMVGEQVQNIVKATGGTMAKAIESFNLSGKVSGLQGVELAVGQRAQLEKEAAKQLKVQGAYVPLNLVFDHATANGAAKYELKARRARSEMAAQQEDVDVAVERSRTSHLETVFGKLDKAAYKDINAELDGLNFGLGKSATSKFIESLNSIYKDKTEPMIDFIAKVQSTSGKSPLEVYRNNIQDASGKRKIGVQGGAYMPKAFVDEMFKHMTPDQIKEFESGLGDDKAMRRNSNGDIEIASFEARKGSAPKRFNA